jgi:hypothetical protein
VLVPVEVVEKVVVAAVATERRWEIESRENCMMSEWCLCVVQWVKLERCYCYEAMKVQVKSVRFREGKTGDRKVHEGWHSSSS